jgi:hypothetical protein
MDQIIELPLAWDANFGNPRAKVTPELARQIVALSDLPGRIEAIRTNTDTLLIEMDKRIDALERHYHYLKPGQTALPVTDEGPTCKQSVQVAPAPADAGRARIVGGLYDGAIQRKPVDAGPAISPYSPGPVASATPPADDAAASYLANGGLFNPELMDHEKVRDMVMVMREQIAALRAAAGEAADKYMAAAIKYDQRCDEVIALRAEVERLTRERDARLKTAQEAYVAKWDEIAAERDRLASELATERETNKRINAEMDGMQDHWKHDQDAARAELKIACQLIRHCEPSIDISEQEIDGFLKRVDARSP